MLFRSCLTWLAYLSSNRQPAASCSNWANANLAGFSVFFATGWIVDSFSRKKILASCAILDAFVLAGISALMLNEKFDLWLLFGCIFVHGTVMALYFPSSQAIIPNIVPKDKIRRAIALSSTINNVAQTCGPLLAGILLAVIDVNIYIVMTSLMLASAFSFRLLPNFHPLHQTSR